MIDHNEYEELANMADWGNKMKDQRDKLLAVCELLLEWNTSESLTLSDIVRRARTAIAKVKGE